MEQTKQKQKFFTAPDIIYKVGSVIVLAFFATMFVSAVFFNNSADYLASVPRRILQFAIALIVLFLLYRLMLVMRRFFIKAGFKFETVLFLSCAVLYLMQYYIALQISTQIGWDPGNIVNDTTASLAIPYPGFGSTYLSSFPNNIFLFYIVRTLAVIFREIRYEDLWLGLDLFNAFAMNLSIFIFCKTARALWGSKTAGIFFILSALLVGLSPAMIIPYSDTFGMPVVAAICWFALKANAAETTGKRVKYAVLFGVTLAVGWLLKPFVLAIVASLFIVFLIAVLVKRKSSKIFLKRMTAGILAAAVAFTAAVAGCKVFNEHQKFVVIDKSKSIPYSYTAAMGIVETYIINDTGMHTRYGYFSGYVNELIAVGESMTEEKNAVYVDYIKYALETHGFFGYIRFLFNKARWLTSEGFFAWGSNGAGALKTSPFRELRDMSVKQNEELLESLKNATDEEIEATIKDRKEKGEDADRESIEKEIAEEIEKIENTLYQYQINPFLFSYDYDLNFFTSFFYPEGQYIEVYLDIISGIWAVALLGVAFGCLFPILPWKRHTRRGFNPELFLRLIPFMILFLLLFTEGNGRYVFGYVPVFCVVSANGWRCFIEFAGKKLKKKPVPVEPVIEAIPEETAETEGEGEPNE